MSYIGNSPVSGPSKVVEGSGTGDNTTTVFPMGFNVTSDQDVMVFLDGIKQDTTSYSVSGSNCTFTTAPLAGENIDFIGHTVTSSVIPQDGSVSAAKIAPYVIPNFLQGLTLSNNTTDSAKDIDIATGIARDNLDNNTLQLHTVMTKQLDTAWAAGTNDGGLFSGTVAINTWYHVFLIRKESDGSIDAGFDTDVDCANIPTGYTSYRRLGSVKTDGSSNIYGFTQFGDEFTWHQIKGDRSAAISTTRTLVTVSTPPNVMTLGRFNVSGYESAAGLVSTILVPTFTDDVFPSTVYATLYAVANAGNHNKYGSSFTTCIVDVNSQVAIDSSGSMDTFSIGTISYSDLRGKE